MGHRRQDSKEAYLPIAHPPELHEPVVNVSENCPEGQLSQTWFVVCKYRPLGQPQRGVDGKLSHTKPVDLVHLTSELSFLQLQS